MKPIIIIPAYKPPASLINLIEHVVSEGHTVVVVNDGSGSEYDWIFQKLALHQVHLIAHGINLGKGQALKTAFNYVLTQFPGVPGVVTADADGQHLAHDIFNVANALTQSSDVLWLGARTFEGVVPLRSRFGNSLTRLIFRLLIGQSLQDTQTGLRGIPMSFLSTLLRTTSSGYDFELDMLILAAKNKVIMKEISIDTVYENKNKSSHFNPLIDSLKIYFVFFRFMFFSIISGLLDFLAFSLMFFLSGHIFFSESLARVISGTFNFALNKELVFKSRNRLIPEAFKYATLCLVNLVFSYALITSLTFVGISAYASKMIALVLLFFANFAIQKIMVFNRDEESAFSTH